MVVEFSVMMGSFVYLLLVSKQWYHCLKNDQEPEVLLLLNSSRSASVVSNQRLFVYSGTCIQKNDITSVQKLISVQKQVLA